MTPLKIEYVPIGQLKPFAGNPRKNDESVDAVVKSIEAFGYTNPILARRENNEIIAGHTRLKALLKMGKKKAPVIFLDLDETDARVYSIFDNKSVENAEWDFPKLADLLVDFDQLDVDLDLTGFDTDEIEAIAPETFGPPQRDDDDVIPESPPPVCKTGDLWILGNHRLLCRDCTIQANVERLMGGVKADMVFTDPPYNVDYSNTDRPKPSKVNLGRIANDKKDIESFGVFVSSLLLNCDRFTKESASLYLWYASASASAVFNAFRESRWSRNQEIIWKKPMLLGRGRYQWAHEPCIFAIKGSPYFTDDRTKTTVWDFGGYDKSSYVHPTQKLVALSEEGVNNSSQPNDLVFDPFLGSGTTLIACEKLNRRCYGMEIEPKYCDVIIKRWEDYTGKKAELDETHPPTD